MTHRTVQPVIDAIADKGLAVESVRGIYKQLTTIVNNAVQDDIIEKNKLGHIILRGKEPRPKDVSVTDYKAWIEYAQKSLRKHEYAMICVASLGLRAGELLGLRTTSIEFDNEKKQRGNHH